MTAGTTTARTPETWTPVSDPATEPQLWDWLPSVAVTLLTPLFLALVIGLRSPGHRVPCALSLALAVVPWLLLRRCSSVTGPGRRFGFEMASYTSSGAWLAIALWAVLDHHR